MTNPPKVVALVPHLNPRTLRGVTTFEGEYSREHRDETTKIADPIKTRKYRGTSKKERSRSK